MPRALSRLRVRLLLLVVLAVFPAFVLLSVAFARERATARASAEASALATARLLSVQQDDLIASARDLLAALAALPAVRDQQTGQCDLELAALKQQYPGYTAFWSAGADGTITCSSTPVPAGVNNADSPWFRDMLASRAFTVGSYQVGRVSGRAVITLALPLLDEQGDVAGGMMTALDLAWLSARLDRTELPAGARVNLIDRTGTTLAHYPEDAAALGRRDTTSPLARAMLARDEGTIAAAGADGTSRLYGFSQLGHVATGVAVSVGIPMTLAYKDADAAHRRNVLLLALTAVGALLAAWFGADLFILRQLRALTRGAQTLASGAAGVRVGRLPGGGELAELARDFDQMAAALDARRAELLASEARFRALVQHASDMIVVYDQGRVIQSISPSVEKILGFTPDELVGTTLLDLVHPEDGAGMRGRSAAPAPAPGEGWTSTLRFRHKDGGWRHIESYSTNLLDDPNVRGIVANSRDVSERVAMQEQLERQARELHTLSLTDELTELTNRRGFMTLAAQYLKAARRTGQTVLLLFADLDGLKSINDTLGHSVGDAAIAEAAALLRATFRESDIVARLGGDEFAVLALVSPAEPLVDLVTRLHGALAERNARVAAPYLLSMSAGAVRCDPPTVASLDGLIARADALMYEQKRSRGGRARSAVSPPPAAVMVNGGNGG